VRGSLEHDISYTGYSPMKKLTEETGGRLIDVANNAKKLEAAFQQIEDELRNQYVARISPATSSRTAASANSRSSAAATA
jgi:ppGpp synthetase/RelA/SpoT-type nucleotidyltranferase